MACIVEEVRQTQLSRLFFVSWQSSTFSFILTVHGQEAFWKTNIKKLFGNALVVDGLGIFFKQLTTPLQPVTGKSGRLYYLPLSH